MSRPLRVEYPGAIYHITSRGNARQAIFDDDEDREMLLSVFAEVVTRFNFVCHAYCLMDNHYHFVIETPDANLSKGMRQLNGLYTQRFNRRHHRVGHLLQGRFKAIIVERDPYLLELCRYVVLNPVRAKRVRHPKNWAWSSYRASSGIIAPPTFLSTDWLLSQFAAGKAGAQERYREFVLAGRNLPSIWKDLNGQIYLGRERFVKRLQKGMEKDRNLSEIPRAQRRLAAPLDKIVAGNRENPKRAMREAYRTGDYSLAELARHFNVHYSTVSRAVRQVHGK